MNKSRLLQSSTSTLTLTFYLCRRTTLRSVQIRHGLLDRVQISAFDSADTFDGSNMASICCQYRHETRIDVVMLDFTGLLVFLRHPAHGSNKRSRSAPSKNPQKRYRQAGILYSFTNYSHNGACTATTLCTSKLGASQHHVFPKKRQEGLIGTSFGSDIVGDTSSVNKQDRLGSISCNKEEKK